MSEKEAVQIIMRNREEALAAFIKLVKPSIERAYGIGVKDADLATIFGQAMVCMFNNQIYHVCQYVGPRDSDSGFILLFVPEFEGTSPDSNWKIMEEHRNLTFDEALKICSRLNSKPTKMPESKQFPDPSIPDASPGDMDALLDERNCRPTDLFSGIPPSKPGDPTFAEIAFALRQEEGTEEEFCTHCGKKFTPENRLANYAENPETGKRGPACQECMNIKKELAPFFIE